MLAGLKIIELATYIAAPGAGAILADWGAEIIKIEPTDGDPIRKFFDTIGTETEENPVFDMDNRGKRGVAIDFGREEGRQAVERLLQTADVFLTNLRPGALARAGLDYERVSKSHPKLIYASVTGYGLTGPEANKPGFDLAAFWARAGVGALTTPKGAEPFPLRTGVGDHTCSIATAAGILAAVVERSRTGKGRLVETSLLKSGVYSISSDMSIALRFGKLASNRPRADAVNPLNNFFLCRDGRWICLLPRQGSADWPKIAKAASRADLLDDPRFQGARARRTHGRDLVAELDKGFASMDFAEAAQGLDREDVVWSPMQSAKDVIEDPQAHAAGCFVAIAGPTGEPRMSLASPVRFGGFDEGVRPAPPSLGQHTDEVLAELGYSAEDIARLRGAGIVA